MSETRISTLEIQIDTSAFERALERVAAADRPTLPAPPATAQMPLQEAVWSDVEGPSTKLFAITIEAPMADLEAIPQPLVAVEDAEWFDVSEVARSVLRAVDGGSTVERLMATLDAPPEEVLLALRELEDHELVKLS